VGLILPLTVPVVISVFLLLVLVPSVIVVAAAALDRFKAQNKQIGPFGLDRAVWIN